MSNRFPELHFCGLQLVVYRVFALVARIIVIGCPRRGQRESSDRQERETERERQRERGKRVNLTIGRDENSLCVCSWLSYQLNVLVMEA